MNAHADILIRTLLGCIMAAAAYTDLRSRKIPNAITYSSMVFMLAYFTTAYGLDGFLFSVKGLLLGTALLLPVYCIGGLGAGDAKLMGAAGAALGAHGVFTAFLFAAIAGGLYALGMVLLRCGNSRGAGARVFLMVKTFMYSRRFTYIPGDKKETAPKLCYAIPIAIGTAGALAWHLTYHSYLI